MGMETRKIICHQFNDYDEASEKVRKKNVHLLSLVEANRVLNAKHSQMINKQAVVSFATHKYIITVSTPHKHTGAQAHRHSDIILLL